MRYFFLIFFLTFFGCSLKKPVEYSTYLITIKSKNMRFSDIGYIKRYDNGSLEVEIYSAGTALIKLKIDGKVCSENGCLSKESFNKKFFSREYPPKLFERVLLGKPIFDSKNLIKKGDGFEQTIYKKNSYDIIYKVNSELIYFKDRFNKILIKVKKIE